MRVHGRKYNISFDRTWGAWRVQHCAMVDRFPTRREALRFIHNEAPRLY